MSNSLYTPSAEEIHKDAMIVAAKIMTRPLTSDRWRIYVNLYTNAMSAEHVGHVSNQLTDDHNGELHVQLNADNPQVAEVLNTWNEMALRCLCSAVIAGKVQLAGQDFDTAFAKFLCADFTPPYSPSEWVRGAA